MKTTRIFAVHGPASLMLMSKYGIKLIGDSYDTCPQQDDTSAIIFEVSMIVTTPSPSRLI